MTDFFPVFILGFMTGLASALAVFAIVGTRQKKVSDVDDELRIAKEIIASGVDYYKRLHRLLHEIRILRHDYKYQIGVVEELAKISNAKHINEFLESTKTRFILTEPVVYCENMAVSALLANYMERFAENKIPFDVQAALPDQTNPGGNPDSLDNYEICMLLGNLLENSLEGTMTVSPSERRVSLNMRLAGGQLLIEVKNSFDGKLFLKDGRSELPLTRKGAEGGYGLKSIVAICKRHGGQYFPRWTKNEYMAQIYLYV